MFNRIIPLILLGCCAHLSAQDWNQDYTVASNTAGDKFASSICAIGDVNGDQVDDFVTGTPQESSAHFNSGSISIYSGADGSLLATRSGEEHGEQAGSRFAYLGLYSNTDVALFACSSPFFASSNGMFSGIVRIYSFDKSTQTLDLFHTIDGPMAGTMFGMSLASYQFDLI
ncbi:MAG: FG-GAP repeat protein, partial [Planctomycetota bacterium]|nr:FG-GAP repeat protein [Planctomycetota bacterium]